LIRNVIDMLVCGILACGGLDDGSAPAGGTALAIGAAVASKPTEPNRERKVRRDVQPKPVSVPDAWFLFFSSDISKAWFELD